MIVQLTSNPLNIGLLWEDGEYMRSIEVQVMMTSGSTSEGQPALDETATTILVAQL